MFYYGGNSKNSRKWSKYGEVPACDVNSPLGQKRLKAWKTGKTGFPVIDAWMRELVATAWMGNRGRQTVASFLVYNLFIDWRYGAEFFEHHLIDHSVAINYVMWNIMAGIGWLLETRTFNVILQSRKWEPDGSFIRKWVPELKDCPTGFIHTPWDWPEIGLYPELEIYRNPIIDKHTFRYEKYKPEPSAPPSIVLEKKSVDKNFDEIKRFNNNGHKAVLSSAAEVVF